MENDLLTLRIFVCLARRRSRGYQRTQAEQLDYEMELLRAQREGREEEFKRQEREKLRSKFTASLDAEMDEYFKSRPTEGASENGDAVTKDEKEDAGGQEKPDAEVDARHEKQSDKNDGDELPANVPQH